MRRRDRGSPRGLLRPRSLLLALIPALLPTPPASAQPHALDVQSPRFERAARKVPAAGTMRLGGLQLGPGGRRVDLALERFEVFAPAASLVLHGANGAHEEPAPRNAYFRGVVIGDPGSRALVTVRGRGGVRGLVLDGSGSTWVLGGGPAARGPAAGVAARRLDDGEFAARSAAFDCGSDGLAVETEEPWTPTAAASALPESPLALTASGPAERSAAPAWVATLALETDHEFFQLFGDAVDAADYVGDLVAFVSTIYEEEVGTRLEIGSLSLWTTPADPWDETSASCGLYEFGRHWNDNNGQVERTIAHFLSGRGGGGVAWVGVLCQGTFNVDLGGSCPGLSPRVDNYGGDYGYSAGISGTFDLQNPGIVWDAMVVAHEIGHNFSSRHTHCYAGVGGNSEPIDACSVSQCGSNGCACGSSALPADCPGGGQGCGTVMSYCHLQTGGLGNIAWTLGQGHGYGVAPDRVPARMSDHVAQRAASFPGCFAAGGSPPEAAADAWSTWRDLELGVGRPGVLANDSDPDGDTLSAVLVTPPVHGELSLAADGSFVYSPDAGFSGVDSFEYRASDGVLESDSAEVTIDVVACGGVDDLVLSGRVVTSPETHSACHSISVGPDLSVTESGALTLEAGAEIVLTDGFSVAPGTTLEARHSSP